MEARAKTILPKADSSAKQTVDLRDLESNSKAWKK
jgi:hypothetical protein